MNRFPFLTDTCESSSFLTSHEASDSIRVRKPHPLPSIRENAINGRQFSSGGLTVIHVCGNREARSRTSIARRELARAERQRGVTEGIDERYQGERSPKGNEGTKGHYRHRDHAIGGLYRKSRRQPTIQEERNVRRANHAAIPRRPAIVTDDVERRSTRSCSGPSSYQNMAT